MQTKYKYIYQPRATSNELLCVLMITHWPRFISLSLSIFICICIWLFIVCEINLLHYLTSNRVWNWIAFFVCVLPLLLFENVSHPLTWLLLTFRTTNSGASDKRDGHISVIFFFSIQLTQKETKYTAIQRSWDSIRRTSKSFVAVADFSTKYATN